MVEDIDQKKLPTQQKEEDLKSTTDQNSCPVDNDYIVFHRAGKDTKINWDRLKYPHSRSASKQFQDNLKKFNNNRNPLNQKFNKISMNNNDDNNNGLLQIGGHLPDSTKFK